MLSHIGYSAPALLSAPTAVTTEMQRAQSRAFKIIGISEKDALEKHGIGTMREFIEHTSIST
ncbi:hypothetical protein KDA14_06095, partial [Candidatus Saccharibacteria bacterium]|nr:hypothetical protein [Candidatus Saccharibacteria bacterium]